MLGWDERSDAWEIGVKEFREGIRSSGEVSEVGGRHEECAGEGTVEAGDRDEHEIFAGPDV